jgi:hyaluronoglucosaminidase
VTGPGSPFAVRGVVEGYYGRPWTHEQRLELIEFIAARGMNTFVYAPKDDALVRREWRTPYDGAERARLSELVERGGAHGVDLVFCLSPGLSIRYSSDADLESLIAKFETVAELGVRSFGLLLDDIPSQLQHQADAAAFDDLVDAHVTLVGRVFDRLERRGRLFVCPTVYWGYGDEDYVVRLGRGIDPRVELFWTGRAICSATLDLDDAATFARSTGRPATFWDNYPVNDVAMGHELHIGPYRGRDRHLWRFATGVIANGMDRFEASKIAFGTIADYLVAPETYDPEASWQRAMRDVVGDADLEAFAAFADNVRSSCLAAEDAPIVTRALERFAFETEYGEPEAAATDLAALADRLLASAEHLLRGPVANTVLIEEARPWIKSFQIGAEAMRCMADLARSGRLHGDGRAELVRYLQQLRQAHVRVFGDALDMTLDDLTATHD